MAGSSEDDRRRRERDDEPEEGELVPAGPCDSSDMDTDDYYNRDCYLSSDDTDEITSGSRALSVPVPANNSTSTSSSSAAAANGNGSSSSPVAAAVLLACPICGKEFRSSKAVCGHMKVHQHQQHGTTIGRHEHEQQQGTGIGKDNKQGIKIKRNVAVAAGSGWGGTGKRGGSGCWSKHQPGSSPNAQPSSDHQSMAIVVVAEPPPKIVLQPMPLAFAAPNQNHSSVPAMASSTMTSVSDESGSTKPTTMHSDAATETVVANPPADQAVVHLHAAAHAPPSPPPAEVHVHATSSVHQQPIELAPPPPVHCPNPTAEEQRVQLPPPPVHCPNPIAPPLAGASSAGRQNPNGYTCKQCGEWFATHQGLGGHMAAHKTRELAAVPRRADAKPAKEHVCETCGAVFQAGVQLGGHMRKHYSGVPIVPKKKPRLLAAQTPPPTPAAPSRVLLFGVDIGAPVKPPAAPKEEGSTATATETQAPSSSTGREQ